MLRTLLVFLTIAASSAGAHEFWLSPPDYQVDKGAPVVAHIRVGQEFKGAAYSYIARQTERFDIVMNGQVLPVTSTIGDRPALNQTVPQEGLAIAVHETTDNKLVYKEWVKFENFVKHKDFTGALEAHLARGLPQTDFTENYRRFAKSLIAVGTGTGQDQAVGLRTEIVALKNPYTDDLSAGMPVQVLFEGAPRPNTQVELFARPPGAAKATVTLHRTNAQGIATLPMQADTDYMVDAVVLLPLDPSTGAVWESLWANLTFQTR